MRWNDGERTRHGLVHVIFRDRIIVHDCVKSRGEDQVLRCDNRSRSSVPAGRIEAVSNLYRVWQPSSAVAP